MRRLSRAVSRPLLFALALLATSWKLAAAQDTIAIVGTRDLTVNARSAVKRLDTLTIPVRIVPDTSKAKFALRVVQVTLGGQMRDRGSILFVGPIVDSSGFVFVSAVVDLSKASDPGAYAVRVQAARTDKTAAPQLLEFTITRPAAELRVAAPVRIDHTKRFFGLWTATTPEQVVVSEVGGRSAVVSVDTEWVAELRRADNRALNELVTLRPPSTIDAWKQVRATLALNGSPPVGTANGTLTIRSHQLTAQALDIAVEVVTRVSRFWLFAAIVASIFLGYLTRTKIDERKRRDEALRAVIEQNERLADLAREETTPDAQLRAAFVRIRDALIAATPVETTSPENLVAAATTAKTTTDAAVADAEARRTRLRADLAAFRAALGTPEVQTASIREIVAEALGRTSDLERRLSAGEIAGVEADLAAMRREVLPTAKAAVERWVASINEALERIDVWPDRMFNPALGEVRAEAAALRASPATSTETFGAMLGAAAALASNIRDRVIAEGASSLRLLAEDVRTGLVKMGSAKVNDSLAGIDDAVKSLGDASTLDAFANSTRALRAGLQRAIRTAYSEVRGEQDPVEPEGLNAGQFKTALEAVSARWLKAQQEEDRALGTKGKREPKPRAEPLDVRQEQASETHAVAPRRGWDLLLVVVGSNAAVVGEPVTVEARIVGVQNAAPRLEVEWRVLRGEVVQEPDTDPLRLRFVPRVAGRVDVRAVVRAAGVAVTKEITINVVSALPSAIEIAKRRLRDELIQTVVAGALIAITGYMIFQGSWYGTGEDWLAAILWGYTVDIGVAKVRELATPLASKTIPLR